MMTVQHLSIFRIRSLRSMTRSLAFALFWVSAFAALTLTAQAVGPTPLSPAGQDARHPAIAVTKTGVVHVVWEQNGGLWTSRLEQSGWTAPEQVAAEGESPALAAAPVGDEVYLAWAQEFGGDYEIFTRRWNGSQWSNPQNVSNNDGGSAAPTFAIATNGEIHLIWADTSAGEETLYHAMSTDGVAWPTASAIPNARGGNPTAVFAADGSLHVAWQHRAGFGKKLRIWATTYATSWQTPVVLTDGAEHALNPTLAAGPGRTLLAWEEGGQTKLAAFEQGGWQVKAAETGRDPALGVNAHDVAYWAWETDAEFRRRFGLGGWSDILSWAVEAQNRGDLALVMNEGQAHMVWAERGKGGSWQVLYDSETLSMLYQPMLLR